METLKFISFVATKIYIETKDEEQHIVRFQIKEPVTMQEMKDLQTLAIEKHGIDMQDIIDLNVNNLYVKEILYCGDLIEFKYNLEVLDYFLKNGYSLLTTIDKNNVPFCVLKKI